MVKVNNYRYVQSTPGTLKQGVKNHRTPKGAVAGGNGSFIMPGESPKIYLYYTEDGKDNCLDIYPFVKAQSTRRVTEKYANEICSTLKNKEFLDWKDVRDEIFKKLY